VRFAFRQTAKRRRAASQGSQCALSRCKVEFSACCCIAETTASLASKMAKPLSQPAQRFLSGRPRKCAFSARSVPGPGGQWRCHCHHHYQPASPFYERDGDNITLELRSQSERRRLEGAKIKVPTVVWAGHAFDSRRIRISGKDVLRLKNKGFHGKSWGPRESAVHHLMIVLPG